MKKLLVGILALFSVQCFAYSCYEGSGLEGYTIKEYDNYKIIKDTISKDFLITLNGKNSKVSISDIPCTEAPGKGLLCIYADHSKSTIESWNIDALKGVVTYNKTMSGWHGFEVSGSTMMKGDITECDIVWEK